MSVSVIVFSKDRAMQLDALLDSLYENLAGDPLPACPTVIWTASNGAFIDGYDECRRSHDWVEWRREVDFQNEYESVLPDDGFVVHYVDDDIQWGRANLQHAAFELDRDDELIAFSLRLGANTTYCYPLDQPQPLPASMVDVGGMLTWRFVGQAGDFSYPFSLDGTVMRCEDVRALLHGSVSNNPNQLEQTLASRAWMRSGMRPKMACYARSVVTGIPVNVVSTTHANRHWGNYNAAALNDAYLDGVRIDWKRMDWDAVDAAHAEVPFVFSHLADKEAA